MSDQHELEQEHDDDGVDRRGFLKCMAWAGTGAFFLMEGGVPKSYSLSRMPELAGKSTGELAFAQLSDSHMGFNKPANPDVVSTLKAAVDKINALVTPPEFILHTGDISHLSKPEEFDTVDQVLKSASAKDVFYVPGEHDVLEDEGKQYLRPLREGSEGRRLVQLRQEGRALHRVGERDEPQGRRPGHAWRRATRLDERRRQASEAQHADRCLRAHSAVDRLPAVGLGDGRQRPGARVPEEIRLGHRAERAHPPDDAEG